MPRSASPPPQVRVRRAVAAVVWPAASANSRKPLLQEAAKHAAEFGRAEVDTEHLLLALADSDVVKTILGQFKIKVDDLKRQIESEAKRGDKPFEGEIGVSPRVKDALSRAFVTSMNSAIPMSVRSTSWSVWPRKAKGWPPTCCAVTA